MNYLKMCVSFSLLIYTLGRSGLVYGNQSRVVSLQAHLLAELTQLEDTDLKQKLAGSHAAAFAEDVYSKVSTLKKALLGISYEMKNAVNPYDIVGLSDLLYIELGKNVDTIEALLFLTSKDPFVRQDLLQTNLMYFVIMTGQLDSVRALLRFGHDPNQFCMYKIWPENNYRALNAAARFDQTEIAEILLQAGADPNTVVYQRDYWSATPRVEPVSTPISVAQDNKNERLIQVLLKAGADPDLLRKLKEDYLRDNATISTQAL
jgi:ankyrin repeat protein